MPRIRRSRQEWSALISELEGSGDDVVTFAERHELKVSTLRWWRSELRRRPMTLVHVPAVSDEPEHELVVTLGEQITVRLPTRSATPGLGQFLGAFAREILT
jgi:hypothetical protein